MAQITSPIPGTLYTKSTPDVAPFKASGDQVSVGDTLGLVEVMKTFIEIISETAGVFKEYSVGDRTPVAAGQKIAEVSEE